MLTTLLGQEAHTSCNSTFTMHALVVDEKTATHSTTRSFYRRKFTEFVDQYNVKLLDLTT